MLSLLIAVAITWAGFSIALRGTGRMANLVAGGFVIGGGVVAMHHTAMAAATMICTAQANQSAFSLDGAYLPCVVFVLALICLGASVVYVWIGKSLAPGSRRVKSSAA